MARKQSSKDVFVKTGQDDLRRKDSQRWKNSSLEVSILYDITERTLQGVEMKIQEILSAAIDSGEAEGIALSGDDPIKVL